MSDRPRIVPNLNKPLVNQVSMATTYSSPATIINTPGISYDINWTGTPTGTFSVEVSNSYAQNADGSTANAGNWTTLALTGTLPAPAGSAGNGFIDIVGTEAFAIRLTYTRVSGTGSLTVLACAKVL